MKIAIIHFNLAAESGDPRVVFSLAHAFKKLGHTVVIYTAQFDKKYFPNLHKGLDIREITPPAQLKISSTSKGILNIIRERLSQKHLETEIARRIAAALEPDFDIVDCHNDYSYQVSRPYRKRNPKAKIVYTMHNPPYYHAPKPNQLFNLLSIINAKLERLKLDKFLSSIDAIITLDEERKKMAEQLGLPVKILRIPVDFEKFYQPVKAIKQGQKKIILLGVGALSPLRRFEDIISAGADLRHKGYDARVILVCKDFWNDKIYREKVVELAKTTGMERHVDFRFEGVSDEELQRIQRQSDVFVFPNVVNIWGMAAFEAMAAGLPLVVSRVTSVAEVLSDGENALFSIPGVPDSIANKVMILINRPALYKKIASAGQLFVKNNLNWTTYARNFIRFVAKD